MKKLLLFAAAASLATASFAQEETTTTPSITVTTQWAKTRINGEWATDKLPAAGLFNGGTGSSRQAAVTDKYVVVLYMDGADSNNYAVLYDKNTGEQVKTVQLTVDGAALTGSMLHFSCGVDYAGHVWFATPILNEATSTFTLHYISDLENGVAVKVGSFQVNADEANAGTRHDYVDIAGDITRETLPCVLLSASSTGGDADVWGLKCAQGGSEWGKFLGGGEFEVLPIDDLGDGKTTMFGSSAVLKIVYNEDPDQMGNLFYVDGGNTCPILFDADGVIQDKLDASTDPVQEQTGAIGVSDFVLGENLYFVYAYQQNDNRSVADCLGRCIIVKASEEGTLAGGTKELTYPTEGFGGNFANGASPSTFVPEVVTEDETEVCYITHFVPSNGVARYKVVVGASGVNDIVVDNENAPVVYYNLQGVQISNPEAGQLVIKKQGNNVTKVLAL